MGVCQEYSSVTREDTSPEAGRLYDRLAGHFGKDQVFMDIDTIRPGVDFVEVINDSVASCEVLIAVVGKQWLTSTDEAGNRRLDDWACPVSVDSFSFEFFNS